MASEDQIKEKVVKLTREHIKLNKERLEQETSIYDQTTRIRTELQN